MSYGKVHSSFWTDEKVLGLTDQGKLLALYLVSGPHRNAIGCARIPSQYIAADLGWPMQGVSKALRELVEMGFITRDEKSGWTLINNMLRYDPVRGDKAAIGAVKIAKTVPRSGEVYAALYQRLKPILDSELKAYSTLPEYSLEAPSKGDGKDPRSPEPTPTPFHTPEPVPIPEPDLCALAVGLWNDLAKDIGLASIQVLNDDRRSKLRQRLLDCGGIDGWAAAIAKVRDSPFLRGDNDRGWRADFDFVVTKPKFTKLMEGGYDDRGKPKRGDADSLQRGLAGAFEDQFAAGTRSRSANQSEGSGGQTSPDPRDLGPA
jgi:hypothetical protein